MSDLPMRERIAEVLCDADNCRGYWPHALTSVRARYLARADAVLDLWADLPDTAVEAGAEAGERHRIVGWLDYDDDGNAIVLCACGWEGTDEAFVLHNLRASLAAAIAAIKEGKA